METLIQVLTYLALISAAAERVTDIVKNAIGEKFTVKPVHCQLLAAIVGGGIAYVSPPEIPLINTTMLSSTVLPFVIGLAVSGGSGLWHDLLSVLGKFKENIALKNTVLKS